MGVTVNDLLMAILLQALAPIVGDRPPGERRRELAVASIVNLRTTSDATMTTCCPELLPRRVRCPRGPATVARDVNAETYSSKARDVLQTLIAIGAIGAAPAQRQGLGEELSGVGAVTMINVDALWAKAGGTLPPPDTRARVSARRSSLR